VFVWVRLRLFEGNREKLEWGALYPNFAEIAEEEGFKGATKTFRMVAKGEAYQ
jgi:rubrerythrin